MVSSGLPFDVARAESAEMNDCTSLYTLELNTNSSVSLCILRHTALCSNGMVLFEGTRELFHAAWAAVCFLAVFAL